MNVLIMDDPVLWYGPTSLLLIPDLLVLRYLVYLARLFSLCFPLKQVPNLDPFYPPIFPDIISELLWFEYLEF